MSSSLVAVLSIAPTDTSLIKDSSCFELPPVLMPDSKKRDFGVDAKMLYRMIKGLVATQLTIEGLRIVVLRDLIVFGLGIRLQVT